MLVTVKRLPLLRCLVVLLSLALGSGNAHAALHLDAAHAGPCPEEHAHHHGATESPHHHYPQHDKKIACCCDCLGCTSAAYVAPELTIATAELAIRVHYDALISLLSGRALRPEPGPPRPGTLS